ncbi:MAG TPA: ATPase, T2SS/T4P/T4SS family [Caulobacteraceae bacterium]|jgi:general secretion pathway protein E
MDDTGALTEPFQSLEALVEAEGLVPAEALARACSIRAETGERLGTVLARLGLVSDDLLAERLARATGLPIAAPEDYPASPVGERVSPRFLREHRAIPLAQGADGVVVALADPFDEHLLSSLRWALREPVVLRIARNGDLDAAFERLYGGVAPVLDDEAAAEAADLERVRDLTSDAPAIRTLNRLIARAVDERASDIHLEPSEDALEVRFRIDGRLSMRESFPPALRGPVVARLKVLAGLNIAERRLPQDGRLRLAVRGHDIDCRVVTSPTMNGEGAVLRLLDRSRLNLAFDSLGFDPDAIRRLRACLAQPHGILLATGPTGSGKTTTLYTALSELNHPSRKILTIEDPIEYRLPGVNQTQVSPAIGLTFAAALRSFLRQDPDVMMVGEIRDLETAQVAVQAALTGHLILSTLHTNSAASAMTRLVEMGVEPFLLRSVLTGILAQRLVRRLCPHCREPYALAGPVGRPGSGAPLLQAGERLYRARGCSACDGHGYRGRIAIVELLVVDEPLARMIREDVDAADVERAAVESGMTTMYADGLAKARLGLASLEDVLAATREDAT